MAFKAYFDGGNQADSRQYEVVTLAALSGSEIQWRNLEAQWAKALAAHKAPWLHTTDALSMNGVFSARNGWTADKVDALIDACVSVLERCCAMQRDREVTYTGVRPATVSVSLGDFKRAVQRVPGLGTVENLCAIQCAGYVFMYGAFVGARRYQFVFDRGERFYGHIKDRTDNRKARRASPWWDRLSSLTEANMREVPALQAADLFAWSVTRFHEEGKARYDWQRRLLAIKRECDYFRYAQLVKPIRENVELVKSWKLPTRRPTP